MKTSEKRWRRRKSEQNSNRQSLRRKYSEKFPMLEMAKELWVHISVISRVSVKSVINKHFYIMVLGK